MKKIIHSSRRRLLPGLVLIGMLFVGTPWVVLLSTSAYGAETPSTYLIDGSLPATLLPPPPAENSAIWKKDIATILAAQKHISPNDLFALRQEEHPSVEMITSVLGASFNRVKLPKTFAMLDNIVRDTVRVVDADKNFWHTKRPYLMNSNIKLLLDPLDKNPGYPSGHTCVSRVLAEVLALLVPSRSLDLRARAEEIAWHRVEAGVHTPSDLEGGRILAMQVVGALTQSDDFDDDMMVSRQEIASLQK